ncbi:uncharacterized protein TNCV_418331 [Trichonephila clavipes]|nr:uncharacterized protein TNCV_418331 [Trichonephila clavipes]
MPQIFRRSPQNVLAVHRSITIDVMPTPAINETSLGSRVNEKFALFFVRVKKNGYSHPPSPSPLVVAMNGNAIETLLMIAHINMDFVNHPVPSTTEPSTSLVIHGSDACESIINLILRYEDYDSHKNAHKGFHKRVTDV